MIQIPQVQNTISGSVMTEEATPSRPPDTAIRANEAIMRECSETFGRLMAAAAPGGLNLVISGTNPSVARPPEKIAGLNSDALAAAGLIGAVACAAADSDSEAPQAKLPQAQATNPTAPPESPKTQAPQTDLPSAARCAQMLMELGLWNPQKDQPAPKSAGTVPPTPNVSTTPQDEPHATTTDSPTEPPIQTTPTPESEPASPEPPPSQDGQDSHMTMEKADKWFQN